MLCWGLVNFPSPPLSMSWILHLPVRVALISVVSQLDFLLQPKRSCGWRYCKTARDNSSSIHENTLSWVGEKKTKQEPCTAKLELLLLNAVMTGLLPFNIWGPKVAETNATAQPPFSSQEQKPRKNTAEINYCCALALPPHIHTAPHRPTTRDRGTNGVLVLVRSLLLAQV